MEIIQIIEPHKDMKCNHTCTAATGGEYILVHESEDESKK